MANLVLINFMIFLLVETSNNSKIFIRSKISLLKQEMNLVVKLNLTFIYVFFDYCITSLKYKLGWPLVFEKLLRGFPTFF